MNKFVISPSQSLFMDYIYGWNNAVSDMRNRNIGDMIQIVEVKEID